MDAFHVGNQIAALVLALVAFGKARFFRSLDADKNLIERRRDHRAHELLVIGKVDRRLGIEPETAFASVPADERRKQFLAQRALVADEIVVDEEHRAAPAPLPQAVQLG